MEKSIDLILADNEAKFADKIIKTVTIIDNEAVNKLNNLVDESLWFDKNFKKISDKRDQSIRHAQRLMRRIIASHGVKYNEETQAVGVSKSDLIYVGDKDRVSANPDAEPLDGDTVKAKVTKPERRKYNELVEKFQWINERIEDHNTRVDANESQLVSFEKAVLTNEEYDKKNQCLVILFNGKVLLCNK